MVELKEVVAGGSLFSLSYARLGTIWLPHFFQHVIFCVMGLSICSGCTRCFFFWHARFRSHYTST
jgi:hypothetical protein